MYRARSLQVRSAFKATNVLLLGHSGSSLFLGKKKSRSAHQLCQQQAGEGAELLLGPHPPVTGHPSGRMGLARMFREEEPKRNSAKSGHRKGDSVFFFFSCTNALISLCWSERHKAPEEEGSSPGTRQQRSHNQSRARLEGEARTWSPTAVCSLFLLARLRLLSSAPLSRDLPWFTRSSSDIH